MLPGRVYCPIILHGKINYKYVYNYKGYCDIFLKLNKYIIIIILEPEG
jgi:hypothetical protein